MTGEPDWTESAAVDRWLAELERAELLEQLVRERLQEEPTEPDGEPTEVFRSVVNAYRRRAGDALAAGQPEVAFALLERSGRELQHDPLLESPPTDRSRPSSLSGQLDLFMAGRPGSAGLPALAPEELAALRDAETPEAALKIISGAARRLEEHGAEARRLLRRMLQRRAGEPRES